MSLSKAAEPAYGIARLIGEGYGKPDGKDETPIDIQYAKIAEWLVGGFKLAAQIWLKIPVVFVSDAWINACH